MLKKIFASIMLVGFVCGSSFAADELALLREEQIGNLHINLSEREVKKTIHCTLKRGPEEFMAGDGVYHQKWEYTGCGITLDMVSDRKGALKSIESITLVSPGTLSTKRGIRMGADLLKRRPWQHSSLKRLAHSDKSGPVGALVSYGISSRHQNRHWSAGSGFE